MAELRTDLAARAQDWLNYVEGKYKQEIQSSIVASSIYGPGFRTQKPKGANRQRTLLMDTDSVTALFATSSKTKMTVLNFASYKYPGRMFLDGSTAQEEALCHKSTLFPVLDALDEIYYASNRSNLNRGLYTDRAIFSKNIVFEVDKDNFKVANVLTCASPNWLTASKYCGVSKSENNKVLKERLRWMNEVLANEEVETFIAGAWGCGVFRQDPEFVANAILEEITYPKKLILAIPAGRNHDSFKKVMEERYEATKH